MSKGVTPGNGAQFASPPSARPPAAPEGDLLEKTPRPLPCLGARDITCPGRRKRADSILHRMRRPPCRPACPQAPLRPPREGPTAGRRPMGRPLRCACPAPPTGARCRPPTPRTSSGSRPSCHECHPAGTACPRAPSRRRRRRPGHGVAVQDVRLVERLPVQGQLPLARDVSDAVAAHRDHPFHGKVPFTPGSRPHHRSGSPRPRRRTHRRRPSCRPLGAAPAPGPTHSPHAACPRQRTTGVRRTAPRRARGCSRSPAPGAAGADVEPALQSSTPARPSGVRPAYRSPTRLSHLKPAQRPGTGDEPALRGRDRSSVGS